MPTRPTIRGLSHLTTRSGLAGVLLALLCGAAQGASTGAAPEPLRPLPQASGADPARAALGRALFYDVRLSRDTTQSCASCHQARHAGADPRPLSPGAGGVAGRYNTPTVYNSTHNFRQTWTGRHSSLDALLDHVISRPAGLATTWDVVAARLTGDAGIEARFERVYGAAVAPGLLKDALGHYLRSLQTPSRFDRYLRGDASAISSDEKTGYAKFKSFGCASCHQGINVGGNMFQKFGALRPLAPGAPMGADLGRFEVTGRASDRHLFRVPSLRNVALTAPYFHNGAVATLDEAVEVMFKYQLGRTVLKSDRDYIVRFLHTLSAEELPPGAPP